MLQKNEVQMSISPFRLQEDRISFAEFTVVTYVTIPTIIFIHPQVGLRSIFLQPLTPLIWTLLFLFIFILSTMITVTVKVQQRKSRNITFIRAFITTIGIFCQQGVNESFRKLSTRVTLLTAILFSLIIYQFYSSFIVSSLLTDSPKTINTLQQLIDSKLSFGIEEIGYNHDFFDSSVDKLTRELYTQKNSNGKPYFEVVDGISLMKKGGFAFHVDTSYAYRIIQETFTEQEICHLHEMHVFPTRILYGILSKNSPFKELFKVKLLRLIETGIVSYQTQKLTASKPKCPKSILKTKALDLIDSSQIFIFLASMMLLSVIILIGEIIHFKISK
jgi:glutamate receptor, ionotropic, invertebrate